MLIKLNLQRFAVPIGVSLNITLDSGIESIHITTPYEAVNTITSNGTYGSFNNKITTFVVTLKNGYIMDKMMVGTSEVTATSENTYEYTFNIDKIAVSFTSKKATSKVSIDLTTLSGWGNVADGQHSIQVVAKADNYRDSEKSTAVSFTKSSGETWVFNNTFPPQFPEKGEYYTEGNIHGLTPTSDYGYFIDFIWKDENGEYNCNYIYNYNFDGVTSGVATYPDGPEHWFNGSMTITGGTDANNVDFLTWLQANGTKQ